MKPQNSSLITTGIVTLILIMLSASPALAQPERQLVATDRAVELTFLSQRNINLYTVEQVSKGELHSSVMHTFGDVAMGAQGFWGLDSGANVRLSLEYGLSDRFSVLLGRTRINKVVDLTARGALLRQTTSGSVPVSVSIIPSIGINTTSMPFLEREYTFSDRLNTALSIPVARKFNEALSLQVTPILVHFNRVGNELVMADHTVNTWYSVALSGRYLLNNRTAVTFQYVPSLTDAANQRSNLAAGLDMHTGGHVFQIFFTTSQGLTEQYLVSGQNGNILDREFRLGFNINRVFNMKGS